MHPYTIGIIASRNQPEYEYFTSAQYPILIEEELGVGVLAPNRGQLWGMIIEQLGVQIQPISGALVSTIVYQTYNNPLWTESLSVGPMQPLSGVLQETIVYKTYNNPLWTENISVGPMQPISGNLQTTIAYVTYNNSLWVESLGVGVLQPISGTLA